MDIIYQDYECVDSKLINFHNVENPRLVGSRVVVRQVSYL